MMRRLLRLPGAAVEMMPSIGQLLMAESAHFFGKISYDEPARLSNWFTPANRRKPKRRPRVVAITHHAYFSAVRA